MNITEHLLTSFSLLKNRYLLFLMKLISTFEYPFEMNCRAEAGNGKPPHDFCPHDSA
ncbi:hypothetical protein BN439_0776 [Erwinia amylovora Ea644]|nr:hypothetical protein BN439_0776 [Erwinia amylovora Ea644]